jgi:hypothetical protein
MEGEYTSTLSWLESNQGYICLENQRTKRNKRTIPINDNPLIQDQTHEPIKPIQDKYPQQGPDILLRERRTYQTLSS